MSADNLVNASFIALQQGDTATALRLPNECLATARNRLSGIRGSVARQGWQR